ncbi:MAG: hypothetical protein AAF561_01300 [Planctomycetota bacterium]
MADYLPNGDPQLALFVEQFGNTLASIPPETLNLTEQEITQYGIKAADFAAKLLAATADETKGPKATLLKNESRAVITQLTRRYAQMIKRLPNITDEQLQALGITIDDRNRRPIATPTESPRIIVTSVVGRTVTIELEHSGNGRGKPDGVATATIFTHLGTEPPASVSDWTFAGNVSRTTVEVPFAPSTTGTTAWITAFWSNAKGQNGPATPPISVDLPAAGVVPVEKTQETPVRLAA